MHTLSVLEGMHGSTAKETIFLLGYEQDIESTEYTL